MKKHDEGYVLAFVMIVIIVLCLVAVSLMSISLRNVQAQTASVERMLNKYTAMGQIEKVNSILHPGSEISKTALSAEKAVKQAFADAGIQVEIKSKSGEGHEFTSFLAEVTITSTHEDTQIDCAYIWEGTLDKSETNDQYLITTTKWDCTSYEITAVTPTEPEVADEA